MGLGVDVGIKDNYWEFLQRVIDGEVQRIGEGSLPYYLVIYDRVFIPRTERNYYDRSVDLGGLKDKRVLRGYRYELDRVRFYLLVSFSGWLELGGKGYDGCLGDYFGVGVRSLIECGVLRGESYEEGFVVELGKQIWQEGFKEVIEALEARVGFRLIFYPFNHLGLYLDVMKGLDRGLGVHSVDWLGGDDMMVGEEVEVTDVIYDLYNYLKVNLGHFIDKLRYGGIGYGRGLLGLIGLGGLVGRVLVGSLGFMTDYRLRRHSYMGTDFPVYVMKGLDEMRDYLVYLFGWRGKGVYDEGFRKHEGDIERDVGFFMEHGGGGVCGYRRYDGRLQEFMAMFLRLRDMGVIELRGVGEAVERDLDKIWKEGLGEGLGASGEASVEDSSNKEGGV